jgi:hypothetical protein
MKKLILIALSMISLEVSAQGNLQFNRVIVVNVYSNNSLNIPLIVPTGKVWKIEQAISSSTSGWIYLNEAQITTTSASNTPFWLPPAYSVTFTTANSVSGKISIIEFNVLP